MIADPAETVRQMIANGWRIEATDCSTVRHIGFKFLWRLARGEDRLHLYF